jgi:epoxyqueuosine reductase
MIPIVDKDLGRKIKDFAYSLGFDLVGIAPSRKLTNHREVIDTWVSGGMHADMNFISRNFDKRTDPALLLEGAKSVVVAALNYYPAEIQGGNGIPVISKYAYGEDYHTVLREKLNCLLDFITSYEPAVSGRVCVDSDPVLEKAWAREAGLGWIGKHSILINREIGSFIFLGEVILNIELQYDEPFSEDFCGNCRLCMDACPAQAINENKTIDARKCISWLTVENKHFIPEEFKDKMKDRIFGCDICQDVCPWNFAAKPHNNQALKLSDKVIRMSGDEWLSLSSDDFDVLFNKSSINRVTYGRFLRNINFVSKSKSPL